MTVVEALEEHFASSIRELAPKIEAALRAAYAEGYRDGKSWGFNNSSNKGVIAGIEAMQ